MWAAALTLTVGCLGSASATAQDAAKEAQPAVAVDDASDPKAPSDKTPPEVEASAPAATDDTPSSASLAVEEAPAAPASPPTAVAPPQPKKACEVVVMNLEAKGLPDDQVYVTELLTNSMAAEIAATTDCKVITQADIKSMIDFEVERAQCGSNSDSCMAEIGNALGVDLIVGGVVGKFADDFTFQAMLRNVAEGKVEARYNKTFAASRPKMLPFAARNAARTLFGVELLDESQVPPEVEPSKPVSPMVWTGLGITGAGLALGAVGAGGAVLAEMGLRNDSFDNVSKVVIFSSGWVAIVGVGAGAAVAVAGAGTTVWGVLE